MVHIPLHPGLYILAMAAVSFVCISLLSGTYLTDLAEIRGEER